MLFYRFYAALAGLLHGNHCYFKYLIDSIAVSLFADILRAVVKKKTIQDFNICLSRAAWHRKRPDQHFLQESCASKCLFADTQCLHSWQSGNLTNLDVLHLPFQPAILNAIILQEEDALLTNMKLPYHLWCIL